MPARIATLMALALLAPARVEGQTGQASSAVWTIEPVAGLGSPTCAPQVRLTGFGYDADGRPIIGWTESGCVPRTGTESGFKIARRDPGGWLPQELKDPSCNGDGCFQLRGSPPELVVAPDGTAFYAYGQPQFSDVRVWMAKLSPDPSVPLETILTSDAMGDRRDCTSDMAFALDATQATPDSPHVNRVLGSSACFGYLMQNGALLRGNRPGEPAQPGIARFSSIDAAGHVDEAGHHTLHMIYTALTGAGGLVLYRGPAGERALADITNSRGAEVSLAIGAGGRLHAAIGGVPKPLNAFEGELEYLWSDDGVNWQSEIVDAQSGRDPSIAVDPFGSPVIAYWWNESELRVATRADGAWTRRTLYRKSTAEIGVAPRLAFDPAGSANVLFYDPATRSLQLAQAVPAPAPNTLAVAVDGPGRVTSTPAAIDCPGACTTSFGRGAWVTLTPRPDADAVFLGWVGACSGTGACILRMDGTQSVLAMFGAAPRREIVVTSFEQRSAATSGQCTLGAAIAAANTRAAVDGCPAGSGVDRIVLPAGVFTLTQAEDRVEWWNLSGLPRVASNLEIVGAGRDVTVIERLAGAEHFRLLYVGEGASLTIEHLTMRGGAGFSGAAIYTRGALTMRDCLLENNDAGNQPGGAVATNFLVPITIASSTIRNNRTLSYGGGAVLYGTVHILDSTITQNTSGYTGGGVFMSTGTAIVSGSEISGNTAAYGGGGIRSNGAMTLTASRVVDNATTDYHGGGVESAGTLTLIGSTVAGNLAGREGGGVASTAALWVSGTTVSGNRATWGGGIHAGAAATILNSTISGNSASIGGGLRARHELAINNATVVNNEATSYAGGIHRDLSSPSMTVLNSILATNRAPSGPDCLSDTGDGFLLGGFNIVGVACAGAATANDRSGTVDAPLDPRLGPLGDNLGLTFTHALLADSPARDAGSPDAPETGSACESTDQRGIERPFGPVCDIGAVEYVPTHTLAVARGGAGSGRIVSNPAGLDCGDACAAAFLATNTVTLRALADPDSGFARWEGCAAPFGDVCAVTLNQDETVTAVFEPLHRLQITRTGNGDGVVTSSPAGIVCGGGAGNCVAEFRRGTIVTLTAAPESSSVLDTWTGVCTGNAECAVTMDSDRDVGVRFTTGSDFAVNMVATPSPVVAGDALTYTISVTNLGPLDRDGDLIALTHAFPEGTTFIATDSCPPAGSVVHCNIESLRVGETKTRTVIVLAPQTEGAFVSTVAVSFRNDPDLSNNSLTHSAPVVAARANLAVSINAPAQVATGDAVTYDLTVTNLGPQAADEVIMVHALPADTAIAAADCPRTGSIVACDIGSLAVGESATKHVIILAPATDGTIVSTLTADSAVGDPDITNNIARSFVSVGRGVADLALSVSQQTESPKPGEPIEFDFVVTNSGPSPATSLTLTGTLPAGAALTSASASCEVAGTAFTCRYPSPIDVNHPLGFAFVLSAIEGSMTVTGSVSAHEDDQNPTNNSASITSRVIASADLAVDITDDHDPARLYHQGSAVEENELTYTITVSNAGPAVARGVVLTVLLPANFNRGVGTLDNNVGARLTASKGSCAQDSSSFGGELTVYHPRVQCTIDSLGVDERVFVAVTAYPKAIGTLTLQAEVTADSPDPVSFSNSDSETTVVKPVADLRVFVSDAEQRPVAADSWHEFNVRPANAGPHSLNSLPVPMTLAVIFPSGWSGFNPYPNRCSQTGMVFSCTIDSVHLLSNDLIFTVKTPSQVGDYEITASLNQDVAIDSEPENNAAHLAVTTVAPYADLRVMNHRAYPDPTYSGEEYAYSFWVLNEGPHDAPNLVITDTLPDGVEFVSVSLGEIINNASFSRSNDGCTASGQTVVCAFGKLTASFGATVHIKVRSTLAGTRTNHVALATDIDIWNPFPGYNDLSHEVFANTPTGTEVGAVLPDTEPGVTATYSSVVTAGTTTIALSDSGPPIPDGTATVTSPAFFDLTTTATYTGDILVCVSYGDVGVDETTLGLYHFENGAWVDITTSTDHVANVICGTTTSLSPFAVLMHINRAPVIDPASARTKEDTAIDLGLSGSDPDGDAITFAVVTAPVYGTVTIAGSTARYVPRENYSGTDPFQVVASDGKLTSAPATMEVTIEPVNDVPVIADLGDQTSAENTSPVLQLTARDDDGDPLTFGAFGLPPGLAIDPTSGVITGTLGFDAAGRYSVIAHANDPNGGRASVRFSWVVTNTNRPPSCAVAAPTSREIWPPNHRPVMVGIAGVTDPDGDPIGVTVTQILQDEPTDPAGGGGTAIDGGGVGTSQAWVRAERAGTPKTPGNGRVYELSFTASDRDGASCSGAVKVSVPHDQGKSTVVDDGVRYDSTTGLRVR